MVTSVKRLTFVTLALLAAGYTAAQVRPSQLSGYVTLTTDYRNRGLSQTDGKPAIQLGVDYETPSRWFTGVFVSNVEYAAQNDDRDTELDIYVGYDWQIEAWGLTATLTRYAYPGADSDYNEITAGVRYRDRVYATTSRTSGFLPGDFDITNHELTMTWPFDRGFEIGATVARSRISGIPGSGYSHWNIGLSKLIGRVSFDVRFYDNDYEITTYIGGARPDQWVLSATYALTGN